MKKLVGWAMLVSLFVALFIVIAKADSLLTACATFGATAMLVFFICVALYLISD